MRRLESRAATAAVCALVGALLLPAAGLARSFQGRVISVARVAHRVTIVSGGHAATLRVRARIPGALQVTSQVRVSARAGVATALGVVRRRTDAVSFGATVATVAPDAVTLRLSDGSRYTVGGRGASATLDPRSGVPTAGQVVVVTLRRGPSGASVILRPAPAAPARRASAAPSLPHMSGTIVAINPWSASFVLQADGRRVSVVDALKLTADAVTRNDYPYVWGGGHAEAGLADSGGSGASIGYDCSGSVAAVLAGGGLWPAATSVPNDAGVVAALLRRGLLARGAGSGAHEVTLFDRAGQHIFMRIDGRYFGTSDGYSGNGSQPHGGAGWLNDGAPDARSRAYRAYHVRLAALARTTVYGHNITFSAPARLLADFAPGASVQVSYVRGARGRLQARVITYAGQRQMTGTVTALAPDGSWVSIQRANGQSATVSAGQNPALLSSLEVFNVVVLGYTTGPGGVLTVRSVGFVASAQARTVTGTLSDVGDGSATLTLEDAAGHSLTVSPGPTVASSGYQSGDTVAVTFAQTTAGRFVAQTLVYAALNGSGQMSGTLAAVEDDGSSFTVQGAGGQSLTFATGGDLTMLDGYSVGDPVQIAYAVDAAGALNAQSVQ